VINLAGVWWFSRVVSWGNSTACYIHFLAAAAVVSADTFICLCVSVLCCHIKCMTSFKLRLNGIISYRPRLELSVCVFNLCMCACGINHQDVICQHTWNFEVVCGFAVFFLVFFAFRCNPILTFGSLTDYIKA